MDGGISEKLPMKKTENYNDLIQALHRLNDECDMMLKLLKEKDAQIAQQLDYIATLRDALFEILEARR